MQFAPLMMRILPAFLVIIFCSGFIILVFISWLTYLKCELTIGGNGFGYMFGFDDPSESALNPSMLGDGDQQYLSNKNNPMIYRGKSLAPKEDSLPNLSVVDEDKLLTAEEKQKVQSLKMRAITNLRRYLIDGGKVTGHINEYGVDFNQLPARLKVNRKEIMCKLKKINFDLVRESTSPLLKGKKFPRKSLFSGEENQQDSGNGSPRYRSCAVIPNSAAFDGAKHGLDIDTHDFVLRFNNAPTKGYSEDVGSITSLRVVNSQVVTKPKFKFPYAADAKIVSKGKSTKEPHSFAKENGHAYKAEANDTNMQDLELETMRDLATLWAQTPRYLIWDPCNFSSSFQEWYSQPDFPVFDKYFELMEGDEKERNRFHLLDCRVIWKLWQVLQEYTFVRIYGNPPTSGFIGIVLALQNCERVNIYEYVPSVRESPRCHYYGPKDDVNPSCTYGSWHPVSAEKLFFLALTDGTDKQIFLDGVLTIPGLSEFDC